MNEDLRMVVAQRHAALQQEREDKEFRTVTVRQLLQGAGDAFLRRVYDQFLQHRRDVRCPRRHNDNKDLTNARLRRLIETKCTLSELREVKESLSGPNGIPRETRLRLALARDFPAHVPNCNTRYVRWYGMICGQLYCYDQVVGTLLHHSLDNTFLVKEHFSPMWHIRLNPRTNNVPPTMLGRDIPLRFRCTHDTVWCNVNVTTSNEQHLPVIYERQRYTTTTRLLWNGHDVVLFFATRNYVHACFESRLPRVLMNIVYDYYEYISEAYYHLASPGKPSDPHGTWKSVESGALCNAFPFPCFVPPHS